MLRTVLLLDGSAAVNSAVDYLPSRLLALRPHVLHLVEAILSSAFAAQIAVVVMRDGVAHRLSGVSSNAGELADKLEKGYFMFGGAGCMSLENGLRLALSELVPIHGTSSASTSAAAAAATSHRDSTQRRVVVVCAAVTSVDHSDIFSIFSILKRQHVAVDVLSIAGATHVMTQLAQQTGGRFICPMNYDQLRAGIESFVDGPAVVVGQGSKARDAGGMLSVAFPMLVEAAAEQMQHQQQQPRKLLVVCSRCALPLSCVPATCPQCKILVCSLPYVHAAYAKANRLAPSLVTVDAASSSSAATLASLAALPTALPLAGASVVPPLWCAECNAPLMGASGSSSTDQRTMAQSTAASALQCRGCGTWRCEACETFIRSVLHACPSCIAASA